MSPREVCWRSAGVVERRIPRRSLEAAPTSRLLVPSIDWERALTDFQGGVDRPVLLDRSRAREIADRRPEQVAALVQAADRICSGVVSYFGYPDAQLGSPIDWNHDPLSDVGWPLVDAARIDHRTAAADPKWIWELNRLQHLPLLAEAWLFTGDDRYAATALAHLDSWLDQNPVGRGVAWRGAFEAGIRALSVAVALQGLRDHEGLTPARFERVVRMLAASAERCWRYRSRYSSANNHLVGELAGLATVAMLFPELAPSSRWERQAIGELAVEESRQILPDGSGAEQAVGYQVFTGDLLLLVAALLASRGEDPPAGLLAAVDRSADYLAAVAGDADPAPRYGDDDEGFALRLGPEPRPTVRDHLGVVAALTGNPRARRAGTDTLTACWVGTVASGSTRGAPPTPAVSGESGFVAPHGGLVVLRSAGRRITMDVGPLGYLAIAAHGHADALAVTLSLDGREVIGHPGAASYYGHPEWRSVHRSTRAHPTVTVDGESQSVPGGPFLWTRHARVRIRSVDADRGFVDAEHDGYRRLPAPVTHRRWLFAPPDDPAVLVVDEISGTGCHEMRTAWPVHPEFDVAATPEGHLVTRHGTGVLQILTAAPGNVGLDQIRGDEVNHLGWWSDRLESRVPAWVLGGTTSGATPLVMATLFGSPAGEIDAVADLDVVQERDLITVAWRVGGRRRERVIDRAVPVVSGRCPSAPRRGTGVW